ncbi:hypothetical protein A4G20_02755 [Pasteurellaceae bacterium RH1A]|nr:hypothetical protein A4G20_02755 [Pasteurellaceae bacterium RH1A]
MKKLTVLALAGLFSTAAMAAPVGSTFTGWGAGLDVTSTKYTDLKQATGVGVVVDYGIDYGNNWVGIIEGKVKLNSSTLLNENDATGHAQIKEKFRASVGYLQGYRVTPAFLPYVKAAYVATKLEGSSSSNVVFEDGTVIHRSSESVSETKGGLGLGVGAKYAVSSNVELGAEYLHTRIKFDGETLKGNTFGVNATYRF